MITALNILMILLLLWIFYEDMKERQITLVWMLLLLGLGGFLNYQKQILEIFLINSIVNMIVILTVVLILWIYSRLKLRSGLFSLFGTGDLLFFIFLAVSFPMATFVVIFSTSLIFSLVVSVALKKKMKKWVPLAGLQALFLGVLVGVNQIFQIVNLYAL
jgi:hypothetical protein